MELLYRDDHLVAVYKPAGWLVHRTPMDPGERRILMRAVRDAVGRPVFPVHRLDKPTAGIVVFALDEAGARRLGAAFARQRVAKTYLAVVRGHTHPEGVIDWPLRDRAYLTRGLEADSAPRPAVTRYRCLGQCERPDPVGPYPTARYSLLALYPEQGRPHQLRRHLKHIGHPIIGDTTHGDGRHNAYFRRALGSRRLLLAALALTLPHPADGRPLALRARPDAEFAGVLTTLGWPADDLPPDTD